ncbi:lipopolysaccharide biosynthesis protein [Vogesella indigofera]|uniref:O-antigen/teichoic acid export membrane protein n=1 Tax=Vogesella indigofera TaxID=45465 RepID=A0ABT5I0F8_VOGIN|nr:hypothetical protein [Vogesella indigofera]MDC7689659.1 hypothetical protein [Vogesella indigofera]
MTKKNLGMVWLALARLGQALIGLVALRAMTYWLSVEQFALLGLMTAFAGFFGLFLINPVGQYINRHTHQWHQQGILLTQMKKYNTYLSILSLLATAGGLVWYGSTHAQSLTREFWTSLLIACSLGLFVWLGTWNNTLVPMLNMLGRRGQSALLGMLTVTLALSASILLVMWQAEAVTWLYGQLIGLAVGAAAALHLLSANNSHQAEGSRSFLDWSTVKDYCLPLAIAAGMLWALTGGYRFVVESRWGAYNLGLLVLGMGVASQFWSIIEAITTQIVYPKYYHRLSANNHNDSLMAFNQMINTIMPIYLAMLGLGVAMASNLLAILADPRFAGAAIFCSIGMLLEACRASTNMINQAAQINKKTTSMIYPYLVAIIFSLIGFAFLYKIDAPVSAVPWVLTTAMLLALVTSTLKMQQIARLLPDYKIWAMASLLGLLPVLLSASFDARTVWQHIAMLATCGTVGMAGTITMTKYNPSFHALMTTFLPAETE